MSQIDIKAWIPDNDTIYSYEVHRNGSVVKSGKLENLDNNDNWMSLVQLVQKEYPNENIVIEFTDLTAYNSKINSKITINHKIKL